MAARVAAACGVAAAGAGARAPVVPVLSAQRQSPGRCPCEGLAPQRSAQRQSRCCGVLPHHPQVRCMAPHPTPQRRHRGPRARRASASCGRRGRTAAGQRPRRSRGARGRGGRAPARGGRGPRTPASQPEEPRGHRALGGQPPRLHHLQEARGLPLPRLAAGHHSHPLKRRGEWRLSHLDRREPLAQLGHHHLRGGHGEHRPVGGWACLRATTALAAWATEGGEHRPNGHAACHLAPRGLPCNPREVQTHKLGLLLQP